jgi:hypothetical protein
VLYDDSHLTARVSGLVGELTNETEKKLLAATAVLARRVPPSPPARLVGRLCASGLGIAKMAQMSALDPCFGKRCSRITKDL